MKLEVFKEFEIHIKFNFLSYFTLFECLLYLFIYLENLLKFASEMLHIDR